MIAGAIVEIALQDLSDTFDSTGRKWDEMGVDSVSEEEVDVEGMITAAAA